MRWSLRLSPRRLAAAAVTAATAALDMPDAEKQRLLDLNPHIQINAYNTALNSDNALALVGAYDLVIDGTDNFDTRYLVNDACVQLGKPLVYGAIYRFDGQISVLNYKGGPCYRCLFPEAPAPGAAPACGEAGVLGALPGIIGAITGRAIYEGTLDGAEAQALCDAFKG